MKKISFRSASFVKTAVLAEQYPHSVDCKGRPLPELAVAGRSNVGKSSLLNDLFMNKKLVKTSSVPGKTQALNFFTVDDIVSFTDLPGYGYAAVPEEVQRQWGPMVQTYLKERDTLKLLLFLLDIRRIPNDDDLLFLEWAASFERPVIMVMTKVDKVSANERHANTLKILRALPQVNLPYVHYSTTKNIGRPQLIASINNTLKDLS